ncbi:hypothetical protein I2494_17440 [Budviciaceae bacterium BWR-B9]|uniref:ImmA/IrrE family metallo-endopeptidase n=1 Tax=Limnobaculum allomyrinae TaxID=2791986 RepID=A0ABS1IUP7_9GAMM|nr:MULTISPECIES: hypothetical protein [Limnobaculum]MBK5145470.1 hypothetical protein [Limnobaculum allomyrinae]MBV7693589.1 hypothetical protein [Limnobaculum sp. M2-1]
MHTLTTQGDSLADLPNYRIRLVNPQIITPLNIPAFSRAHAIGEEKVGFCIENNGTVADSLSLEIMAGDQLIHQEQDTYHFRSPGCHLWFWDGYSDAGIMDTQTLKHSDLRLRLVASRASEHFIVEYPFQGKARHVDWVDVRVDRINRQVDVLTRLSFSDGGSRGRVSDFPCPDYSTLAAMAGEGVELYWSRNGHRAGGIGNGIQTEQGLFSVTVVADWHTKPGMPDFKLIGSLSERFGRSTSLKGFRRIFYNQGFYAKHITGQTNLNHFCELNFKMTAAHEIGHIILDRYGAGSFPDYSWSHKGTSTVLTQRAKRGVMMPLQGEIDLMKYADARVNRVTPADRFLRSVAASEDVKGLIWLSAVVFSA